MAPLVMRFVDRSDGTVPRKIEKWALDCFFWRLLNVEMTWNRRTGGGIQLVSDTSENN